MKTKSGKPKSRILLWILALIVAVIAVFLLIPSNYYVHRALIHQLPQIDHYKIFENRNVDASDPQPWNLAANFNQKEIPHQYQSYFEEMQTVAFLVIQDGNIVFEKYWDEYDAKSYVNSFSMAKTVLGMLVGSAISDGFIKSVDQPVSDFLPEWTSFDGEPITIKHLLNMSAGIKWDEAHSSLFSMTTDAYYGKDLWRLALTMVPEEKPGVRFNYQSGVSQLIAFLLQKAVDKSVSEYAAEKLWTPLGAEHPALWSLDRQNGMEKAFCCFNATARDFARLGQLILNHGNWHGKQLLDSAYVKEMLTPATWLSYTPKPTPDGQTYQPRPCTFYGYQIWMVRHEEMLIPYLRGILGQYVIVIPELNAVVVRLGHKREKAYNIDQNYTIDLDTWLDAGLDILRKEK